MADKEKEAYWDGYNDYKKCKGQANPNPLTEFFHPSYKPPSENKEAYDAGWNRAKQEDNKSGCFITSACVEAKGLPDDCLELNVLRQFRDEYIRNRPDGNRLISEYYEVAPHIVLAINKLKNPKEEWWTLYENLVVKSVEMISLGKKEKAFKNYLEIVNKLKERYL